MHFADEAMYRAKQRGKNRIEVYNQRPSRLEPAIELTGESFVH